MSKNRRAKKNQTRRRPVSYNRAGRKHTEAMREMILSWMRMPQYRAEKPKNLYQKMAPDGGVTWTEFQKALSELRKDRIVSLLPNGKLMLTKPVATVGRSAGSKGSVLPCVLRLNRMGQGFAEILQENVFPTAREIYIPEQALGGGMHGDHVLVRITRRFVPGRDCPVGEVTEVTERAHIALVGTVRKQHLYGRHTHKTALWLIPDDTRLGEKIRVTETDAVLCEDGDKAELTITHYPNANRELRGKITRVFGAGGTKAANYQAILYENGIRTEFPEAVSEQAQRVCTQEISVAGRHDLRECMIFTIDGADAKDLDDAISVEKTGTGYLLGVHIADVSQYVAAHTPMDVEAMARGSSVYFADQVVPMLPRELSNGCCSLHPGVDRYALSAWLTLDAEGMLLDCKVEESVVHSKIRGVYTGVNDVLQNGERSAYYSKYAPLYPDVLPTAVELYEKLAKRASHRGALELETVEAKIVLNDAGNPISVEKRERGIAEKLIEQFMLCANEGVATMLTKAHLPCVYRIHEDPPVEKLQTFFVFAHNLGLSVAGMSTEHVEPWQLQRILSQAAEKGILPVVSLVMLRSLAKAKYAAVPSRHFGLAIDRYCHFTSPIRRYPDLAVHRIVKAMLHGENDTMQMLATFANEAARISTENELRVISAEREIETLYRTMYLQTLVGTEAVGTISGVTRFGLFVELENTCEGLVPIQSLSGYFAFDEQRMTLSCGACVYRLGQRVTVEIQNSDLDTRRTTMRIVPEDALDR